MATLGAPWQNDSGESSARLSPPRSMPGTPGGSKGKKRVGFNDAPSPGGSSPIRSPPPELAALASQPESPDEGSRNASITAASLPSQEPAHPAYEPNFDEQQLTRSLTKLSRGDSTPTVLKSNLKSALRKGIDNRPEPLNLKGIANLDEKKVAETIAFQKAAGLERDVASAPGSRTGSPDRSRHRFRVSKSQHPGQIWGHLFHRGANETGQTTPNVEELDEYFPAPQQYRAGGLSNHLLANWWNAGGTGSAGTSRASSFAGSAPPSPGTMTPTFHITPPQDETPPGTPKLRPWGLRSRNSDYGIHNLVSASASATGLAGEDVSAEFSKQAGKRPGGPRSQSAGSIAELWGAPRKRKTKSEVDITIKKHIQETKTRKTYILKLCKALMEYGAPTHRLEAYLTMTSRVLAIDAQYLYFPGTMIISFDDAKTHTAEMKLVRVNQGVDLGKMKDSHNVYKDITHDLIGVDQGIQRLDELSKEKDKYPIWIRILAFGFGAATVGPFAFGARLIDMPIAFCLGLILGFLQLIVAPKSDLYASVFEIVATIITSFLSRAIGSITYSNGDYIFCFSALAQSSIALILPGFTVLSAALELQSRAIVAGSVRIVYAIVYSLWIGYGLTIGIAVWGAIGKNPSSDAYCTNPISDDSHKYLFIFVPIYTVCLAIINQAKWRQMPMMVLISFSGYMVNYWASTKFQNNAQITSTLGATCISVLANGYSRMGTSLDELAARFENWVEIDFKGRILGSKTKQNPARPEAQRRKSSFSDTLIGILPASLRPSRRNSGAATPVDEDVEADAQEKGIADTLDRHRRFSEEEGPKGECAVDSGTLHEHMDTLSNADTMNNDPEHPNSPQNGKAGGNSTGDSSAAHTPPGENGNGGKDEKNLPPGTVLDRHGRAKKVNYVLAAAAMLPAIFVQVPSGISVAGSLVSGIEAANELTNTTSSTSSTSTSSSSSGVVSASEVTTGSLDLTTDISFTVAASVVQVAIGITIGLFIGSILVYPTGKGGSIGQGKKSRSGLFAF